MFKEVLARMDLATAPSVALVLFMGLFVGVAAWLMLSRNDRHFDQMNKLPLDGGEVDR
ncbi:MAG: cbb3-type cytochrome c oxidase subunit 3 [Deltaproteobacteria bacterium]|nr:cbb3-type cytochrome c oxidase subunit 3 [Deltaproteobacteria bacterium]